MPTASIKKSMNVKCYRAATMREALEQIKNELGEEALVLDTRRVRAGSWFGFGGRELIEVRVAEPCASSTVARNARDDKKRRHYVECQGLKLLDDSPATPSGAQVEERVAPRREIKSASKRVPFGTDARSGPGGEALAAEPTARKSMRTLDRDSLSDERLGADDGARAQSGFARTALTAELERLRAELREVKFALGAFTTHAAAAPAFDKETTAALEADPELFDSPFYEAYLDLTAAGLAPDHARRALRTALALNLAEACADARSLARVALVRALGTLVQFAPDPLAAENADSTPTLAFIGPTGVGKTTTIAKLAARVALRARRRVELITLDTYRIAAIEQLKTYAEIIGAGFHVARSMVELDALICRHATEAVCLIDTIGRSPHDLADQMELADYLRGNSAITKCLVLQATMHPIDALAAARKFALFGSDRLAITKLDETSRPGAAVTIAAEAALPLTYLCAGQRVPEDLEQAQAESFATRVLRGEFTREAK